jgi:hypothetical protein
MPATRSMFPQGRVPPVQQSQMTTLRAANTQAIAIDASFDDWQNMVQAMFANHAFRDQVRLSAVNSINWRGSWPNRSINSPTPPAWARRIAQFCSPDPREISAISMPGMSPGEWVAD